MSNFLHKKIHQRVRHYYPSSTDVSYYAKARFALVDALKRYGPLHQLKVAITLPMCAGVINELLKQGCQIYYVGTDHQLNVKDPEQEMIKNSDVVILTSYYGLSLKGIEGISHKNIIINHAQCFSWPLPKIRAQQVIVSLQYNKFLKCAGGGLRIELDTTISTQKYFDYNPLGSLLHLIRYLISWLCFIRPQFFYFLKKISTSLNLKDLRRANKNMSVFQALIFIILSSKERVYRKKRYLKENQRNIHSLLNLEESSENTTYYLLKAQDKHGFIHRAAQKGIFVYYWPEKVLTPLEEVPTQVELEKLEKAHPTADKLSDQLVAVSIDGRPDSNHTQKIKDFISQEKSHIDVLFSK